MTLGGYGVQGKDPDLADKIANLKRKRSPADAVNNFLEHDLGVDPRQLPLTPDNANYFIHQIMADMGAEVGDLEGNSLGLKCATFSTSALPTISCPACGLNNGYWMTDTSSADNWYCYACDTATQQTAQSAPPIKRATESDNDGLDWHDLKRAFTALVKASEPTYYRFICARSWAETEIVGVAAEQPDPDATHYPAGTVLRLESHVIQDDGTSTSEFEYVRVGGLFDDTTVTILATMQPILDLSGYTVMEVL